VVGLRKESTRAAEGTIGEYGDGVLIAPVVGRIDNRARLTGYRMEGTCGKYSVAWPPDLEPTRAIRPSVYPW